MPEPIRTARLLLVPASPACRAAFDLQCGAKTLADRLDTFTEAQMARLFGDFPLLSKLEALDRAANDLSRTLCYLITLDSLEIGYVSFLSFPSPSPEAQIALLPAHRGNGYASEALSALLPYVFSHGARSVLWRTLPDASSSISLALSLGAIESECTDEMEALLMRTFVIGDEGASGGQLS